jgi:hypothetical protein
LLFRLAIETGHREHISCNDCSDDHAWTSTRCKWVIGWFRVLVCSQRGSSRNFFSDSLSGYSTKKNWKNFFSQTFLSFPRNFHKFSWFSNWSTFFRFIFLSLCFSFFFYFSWKLDR